MHMHMQSLSPIRHRRQQQRRRAKRHNHTQKKLTGSGAAINIAESVWLGVTLPGEPRPLSKPEIVKPTVIVLPDAVEG